MRPSGSQQVAEGAEHRPLGVLGQQHHHVADADDEVVLGRHPVRGEEPGVERLEPGLCHRQVRVRRPRLLEEPGVEVDPDGLVTGTPQRRADPAHARAGVEDPCAARGQRVGQPSLALDVRAARDELGEVAAVAAPDVGRPLPAGRRQRLVTHRKALSPVSAWPMTSWCTSEVPS